MSPAKGEKLIEVKGLEKHFKHVEVLRGINIDICKGDVVAVIGPSGSGKSTFLRCKTVHDIALQNKICGVDVQHIGDAAWGVVPPTETIFELSKTIRGINHTISRMARSINR